MATTPAKDALAEGLADAAGFVLGALAGWQLGSLLGFDLLAPGEWNAGTLVAWGLLMAGCGAGKWASLQWRARRGVAPTPSQE
jgi:hypothetical protein